MSGLKKIKNIFWQEGERQPADTAPITPLSPMPMSEPVIQPMAAPTYTPEAPVDNEFYLFIEQELTKSMPAEFAEFYNQMSVINEKFANLDETTRYQLAFHAAQTALKGRNVQLAFPNLIKDIGRLKEVLAMEQRDFKLQNEQGFQNNLTNVKRQSDEMGQGIKARENRLQALQQEIESFLASKNAEKKKLEEERAKLISQRVVVDSEINQVEKKKQERESRFNSALQAHEQRFNKLKELMEINLRNIK